MGTGTKRKSSDTVIITPKKKIREGGSGSFSGKRVSTDDMELCPASFKIKLPSGVHLPNGTRLIVRQERNTVVLYFGNTKIVKLNAKKGQRIASCIAEGLRYEGTVRKEDGAAYAEVIRTT